MRIQAIYDIRSNMKIKRMFCCLQIETCDIISTIEINLLLDKSVFGPLPGSLFKKSCK